VPDLERALLGPVADPALRETVDALQRLFPGRVLEVVASEDPAPDEPDPLPTEGERDAADEDDDPGGEH
jgi:hypothetical protein